VSAHANANLVRFNFFEQAGAFLRDAKSGAYRVDLVRMQQAVASLAEKILRLQGDGDYSAVAAFVKQTGVMGPALKADLERLARAQGIPVDVVFEQGKPF